jgi:predicted SAM-dependent methyltransferase
MEFLIALQTHNLGNSQDNLIEGQTFTRYGCNDKTEILKRCTRSLIKSINYAEKRLFDVTFKLRIFDDHSTDEAINILKSNMELANFKVDLVHLEDRGLINSLRHCYEYLRDEGKDLVMQAQDDYLFDEKCFFELVNMQRKFNPRFEKPLSLLPYNDPYRYYDANIVPVRIVQGPDRHWRQTYQVPCTFLTHHKILIDEWDLFEAICNGHAHDPKLEDNSVNQLWQERGYVVMSPIPSLSLHFQTDSEKDPYIDWNSWWDLHADVIETNTKKEHTDLFDTEQKIVLNIGCGKTALISQSKHFVDWKEIRIDAFENNTADIICSCTDLDKVPNESVDAIWASHVVEHNYFHDLPNVFKSMMRVLKEDGFAIIRVPDLASIAEKMKYNLMAIEYESSAGPVCVIDMIYGHRGLIEHWGDGMCHKTGFNKETMEYILAALDIKSFVREHNGEIVATLFKNEPPLEAMADPELIL